MKKMQIRALLHLTIFGFFVSSNKFENFSKWFPAAYRFESKAKSQVQSACSAMETTQ